MPESNVKLSALKIISINVESFSSAKRDIIAKIYRDEACHVLFLQQAYGESNSGRPCIPGMKLAIKSPHSSTGAPSLQIPTSLSSQLCLVESTTLSSLPLTFEESPSLPSINHLPSISVQAKFYNDTWVVVGDFNSHSTNWGYDVTDDDRDIIKLWADSNHLCLIHDPKLQCSFNSGQWKRGYNPDIGFISHNIASLISKCILDPIPHTQHRPITFEVNAAISPQTVPFRRCFNFQKANWKKYTANLDSMITNIKASPTGYMDYFTKLGCVSRKTIPRGCRTSYIPSLTDDTASRYKDYIKLYEEDPFSYDPIEAGENLVAELSQK